jgi:hypothetical protein
VPRSAVVPGKRNQTPEEPLRRNNRPAHTPLPGADVEHEMLDESEHLRPAPPPHEPSSPQAGGRDWH